MNPYLEQSDAWPDFHTRFITFASEAITSQLGHHCVAKVEVRLILHELSADEPHFVDVADVGVLNPRNRSESSSGTALAPAPLRLELPAVEVERHRYLEIRDKRNRKVVTVLELLSPTNKSSGADRDAYLGKRNEYIANQINFVEIDLLRGGNRPDIPALPPCDYYALVKRIEDRAHADVWPFALRDSLPVIPIPLLAPDPDAKLDLRAVLDRVYDSADYGSYVYSDTPEPPLLGDDNAWAKQFLPGSQ
jgi:hypothetical protein